MLEFNLGLADVHWHARVLHAQFYLLQVVVMPDPCTCCAAGDEKDTPAAQRQTNHVEL